MSKDNTFIFTSQNSQNLEYNLIQAKTNQDILKQLEILDEENLQLKEALTDLEKDLKDRDQSIEESQKIITKLREEYTKVIAELQQMEKLYNELLDEFKKKSIEIDLSKRNHSLLNDLKKKNDTLYIQKNNLHKENIIMRKKIVSCGNISFKNERNIKNKDMTIDDLQKKNNIFIKMVKERDNLIEKKNKKIKELNDIISNKNGELKIMMNISKEINKENKINVKELTQQAVKTLKTFQNNINKKQKRSYSTDNYRIKLINSKASFEDFNLIFKNNKSKFLLEDAINGVMYIPDNLNSISKEFLINMNLKTELIKSELYSGLIRESQFINFIKQIFDRIHLNKNNGALNIFYDILEFKKNYLNVIKENIKIKKINQTLIKINSKYINDMKSLKENINNNNKIIRNKWLDLIHSINNKNNNQNDKFREIQKLKNEIKGLNSILIRSNLHSNYNSSLRSYQHLSSSSYNNKKRMKSLGEPDTPRILNTLPSWDAMDISDTYLDKNNTRETINDNSNLKNGRIKKKVCLRITNKKKRLNRNTVNGYFNYDNSIIDNNYFITEGNLLHNNTYSNINFNSTFNTIKRFNYKKDIFNLQKEFNNILTKSSTKSSINYNEKKKIYTPKNIPEFKKFNTCLIRHKNKTISKDILSQRTPYKKKDISKLKCPEDTQKSIVMQDNKDIFKNYEKNENNYIKEKNNKNNIFSLNFFINLFLGINNNIFELSELNKYREIYNSSNIETIYSHFKENCDILKNKIDEINIKIEKSHYLTTSNFTDELNFKYKRKNLIEGSFKLFNEKVIYLKKFEFEFINMNEFIKNYLVSQEITIQIMNDKGKKYIKFEPIEKLFNLFQDCLNYRIDEMEENIIFNRKLMIKLFKNQMNCLFKCFELNID